MTAPNMDLVGKLIKHADHQKLRAMSVSPDSLEATLRQAASRLETQGKRWTDLRAGRKLWPLEVRDAVDELEARFDIVLVSGGHHAAWVEKFEALEAKLASLQGGQDDG